ncbi:hypothetical protein AB1Y20_006329 [Prymnesium parvum]|uniref:Uncharacterized protein n=1 Tax=Prymnesium parvum TaxID=97485 RepID=A0AB34J2E5_PRYPA
MAAAYAQLCTDFPELTAEQLHELRREMQADLDDALRGEPLALARHPLSPAFLEGITYGATRRVVREEEVPGLAAAAALPSDYAAVYALCVRRICLLLEPSAPSLREAMRECASAAPPAAAPPEVVVGEEVGEEVWAAEVDDDERAYEPLRPPSSSSSSAPAAPLAPLPSDGEAMGRLARLVGTLRHEALAGLAPAEWERLGVGDGVRRALRCLGGGGAASDAPLAALLRDHLLHEAAAVPAELEPTLQALPEERRLLFLASLVSGGAAFCEPSAAAAWEAVDKVARREAVASLQSLSSHHDEARLRAALLLLSWYLRAPAARLAAVGAALIESGAPQLLLQLVLREREEGGRGGGAALCWEWLLGASLRYASLLSFVSQVPPLTAAVQESATLRKRPAQRTAWLMILAVARANASPSASAMKQREQSVPQSNSLMDEAVVALEDVLRSTSTGVRPAHVIVSWLCTLVLDVGDALLKALNHIIELLQLLIITAGQHGSLGAIKLFGTAYGSRFVTALDDLRQRLHAAIAECDAAPADPANLSKQEVDEKEKRKDLLVRAAAGHKDLVGCLRAPGKKD